MTAGRFLACTAAVAVAMFILAFIGHQLWLGHAYVAIEPIMRNQADMQAHIPFALISCLAFSGARVWIYSQGRNPTSWLGQGLRFGVAVWAIADLPPYLTNYTIEPWPGIFIAKILLGELCAAMILGILTAALAKGDPDTVHGRTV
ncbi:MAG TPA: hypothetical protein VIX37_09465 [Candidatus Sulfotelmatobacter sp.]